jgi:hypothetical protein
MWQLAASGQSRASGTDEAGFLLSISLSLRPEPFPSYSDSTMMENLDSAACSQGRVEVNRCRIKEFKGSQLEEEATISSTFRVGISVCVWM